MIASHNDYGSVLNFIDVQGAFIDFSRLETEMQSHSFKTIIGRFLFAIFTILAATVSSAANMYSEAPALGRSREAFKIGPWVGAEQFLENGDFFSCLMAADYGSGRSAAFGINNDYQLWLGISSEEWRFTQGKTYIVIYAIDKSPQVLLRASAPSSTMLMADFLNAEIFQKLRNAQMLNVTIPELNESIQIPLKQAKDAFGALGRCIDANMGNAPSSDADNTQPNAKQEI